MTHVTHELATGGDAGRNEGPRFHDDRSNTERLAEMWRGWSPRRRGLTAGGLAVLLSAGLAGGRLFFSDDGSTETVATGPGVAAGNLPEGNAVVDPGTKTDSKPNQWTWQADCTDVAVSQGSGGGFTFTPKLELKGGAANPSFLYTLLKFSTEGQAEATVTARRGISPVTANLVGSYGVLQVAAVYFPTNQPANAEAIPTDLGLTYPDAVIAACPPLYGAPEGNPTSIQDVVGDDVAVVRS
jgi:hypothetical protein